MTQRNVAYTKGGVAYCSHGAPIPKCVDCFPQAEIDRSQSSLQASEQRLGFVMRLLRIAWEHDVEGELMWSFNDGQFTIAADCSDTFYWGSADAEEITTENIDLFEQTLKECAALKSDGLPILYASELFAARVRKLRPQGASYALYPSEMWPLFHTCGPEREVGLGNPYSLEKAAERAKDREHERRDTYETMQTRLAASEQRVRELEQKLLDGWDSLRLRQVLQALKLARYAKEWKRIDVVIRELEQARAALQQIDRGKEV